MSRIEFSPEAFFDLSKCRYSEIFNRVEFVWDALTQIPDYIETALNTKFVPCTPSTVSPQADVSEYVYIGSGTMIESGVTIKGPAIIGEGCEIRAGAYIRENVLVGKHVVVGHSTELKHCLLFDRVEVPHLAYVGDSILGWKAHLGADVKISNVKITRAPIRVTINGEHFDTGLDKFGAILGDR